MIEANRGMIRRFFVTCSTACLLLEQTAFGFVAVTSETGKLALQVGEKLSSAIKKETAKARTRSSKSPSAVWWTPEAKLAYSRMTLKASAGSQRTGDLLVNVAPSLFLDDYYYFAGAPIPGEISGTLTEPVPGSFFAKHESGGSWSSIGTKSNAGMNPATINVLNTLSGNKLTGVPLVGWSAPGQAEIDFTLYHNSLSGIDEAPTGGDNSTGFGFGWTHSYNVYVRVDASVSNMAFLVWGDGRIMPFSYLGSNQNTHTYKGPPGVHATLLNTGSNWTLHTKDQWTYTLNAHNGPIPDKYFLTSITDRYGNTVEVQRDATFPNIIHQVEDPAHRKLVFTYYGAPDFTAFSLLEKVTAPDGREWRFDHSTWRLRVYYPELGVPVHLREFWYEELPGGYVRHNIGREHDLRGNWWYYGYNDQNQLIKSANPYGANFAGGEIGWSSYWAYAYATTGGINSTTITDPKGKTTKYNYTDNLCDFTEDELGNKEYYEHDADRNLSKLTDRRAHDWVSTYDTNGNVLTSTNPDGEVTTCSYTSINDLDVVARLIGGVAHTVADYEYRTSNSYQVLDSVTNGNGNVVVRYTEYDAHGQPTKVRDYHNTTARQTTISYDDFGNVTDVTSGTGVTLQHNVWSDPYFTFKKDGFRLLTSTEAGEDPVVYEYDSWGRLYEAWQTYSADKVLLTLDNEGLVTETENQLGKKWLSTYDNAMRLTESKDPLLHPVTTYYDTDDTVTQVKNARNYSRFFTYTDRGEVDTQTMPDGTFETWEYWPTGEVKSLRDGSMGVGQKILYGYRASGELETIDYPDSTGDVLNVYDSAGRLDQVKVDGVVKADYSYDDADQVLQQVTPEGTVENVYLPDGQLEYLKDIGVGNTHYEYDSFGRLQQLTNPFGQVTTFHYEAATDRLYKKVNSNGTFDETTFDNKGRPWKIFTRLSAGGNDPFQRTYEYYTDNKVHYLTDNYNQTGDVPTTYAYDDAGQLTLESRAGYVVSYEYDANGNRWHRIKNGVTETYSCDEADKLTSVSDTNGFARSFAYDNAGRMTSDIRSFGATTVDARVYTWNQGGRLVNHTSSLTGQSQADAYNAAGARVSSTPLGQQPTLYKRAGLGVLAPELSEWKSGTNVVAYTPGISEKRGTTSTWSHSGIKNFDYQSKSNGTVSSARRYDAFGDGQTQVSGSYWRGPWGYGGPFGYYSTNYGPQLIGMETGFTPTEPIKQVGHRWYDPSIGRFISRDPAKDGRNWFAYCDNEPIRGVDPSGLGDFWRLIFKGLGRGGKDVEYLIAENSKDAVALAKTLKPGRQVRIHPPSAQGYPGHLHNVDAAGGGFYPSDEVSDIHVTTENLADLAQNPGWKNWRSTADLAGNVLSSLLPLWVTAPKMIAEALEAVCDGPAAEAGRGYHGWTYGGRAGISEKELMDDINGGG